MKTLVVGCEIGGTKLQACLGTPEGEILVTERTKAPSDQGALAILEWFKESVPALVERAKEFDGRVVGIGVGFGGPVETATGKALVSHQVGGWNNFELKPWFEKNLGLPTFVANDANAAGWAEYCCGSGKGTREFVYNNIGSGIGGAIVIDGKLLDGQGRGAAEIGHTYVPDWSASEPGVASKLEDLCSGWAIERRLHALPSLMAGTPLHALSGGDPKKLTCAMLADAARQGDAVALAEIERVAGSIAVALSNVITLFHPERIAMGGGVSLMGEVLLEPLRKAVAERVFGPYRGLYSIDVCSLGEAIVLVGALLLAPTAEA
jgi:glucokinase